MGSCKKYAVPAGALPMKVTKRSWDEHRPNGLPVSVEETTTLYGAVESPVERIHETIITDEEYDKRRAAHFASLKAMVDEKAKAAHVNPTENLTDTPKHDDRPSALDEVNRNNSRDAAIFQFVLDVAHEAKVAALKGTAVSTIETRDLEDYEVLADLIKEIGKARAKFPVAELTYAALGEEFGELGEALLDKSYDEVRKEAIQVMCVAMRIITEGDLSFDARRRHMGLAPLPGSIYA